MTIEQYLNFYSFKVFLINIHITFTLVQSLFINTILFKNHINPDKDKSQRTYNIDYFVSIINTTLITSIFLNIIDTTSIIL